MSGQEYHLRVVNEGGWKIVVGRDRFGPYSTQDEALFTARMWATNARRQGHQVSVAVEASPRRIVAVAGEN